MEKVILVRYGEIWLKGKNFAFFDNKLLDNIKEKLKNYILERYKSIREFTIAIDIPYSTLTGVLTRGIDNSSVGVIFKICKALNISPDALAEGEIVPRIQDPIDYVTNIDGNQIIIETKSNDVDQILDDTKKRLLAYRDLLLDGKKVKKSEINTIVNGIDISLEMVKKNQT